MEILKVENLTKVYGKGENEVRALNGGFYILPRIEQINFTGVTRNEPCTDGSCKKEYGNMVV